jgi:hypothetical protein
VHGDQEARSRCRIVVRVGDTCTRRSWPRIIYRRATGLDIKVDLARRSAIDILIGYYSHWDHYDTDGAYAHVTYLVTPLVGHGRSVTVPLRVGIGFAVFDQAGRFDDDLNLAVRVPFELGLRFRRTPLELYFEVALKLTFFDEFGNHRDLDLDGGLGLRFYF